MGQYHALINLDKKEYVEGIPGGYKLMEQCGEAITTSTGLWLLLAASNGRGGGDAKKHSMIGRWAGDRIAIIGDYAEPDDISGINAKEILENLNNYSDITYAVKDMLCKEYAD